MLAVEPDASVASFLDADIISTESQRFTPFIGLSDAVNGISVVYPSPEDGWPESNCTASDHRRPRGRGR